MSGDRLCGDVWINVCGYLPQRDVLMVTSLVSTALRAHSVEAVTSLDLSGNGKITDAAFDGIAKLTAVTSLDVMRCRQITDAGVCEITRLLPGCKVQRKS